MAPRVSTQRKKTKPHAKKNSSLPAWLYGMQAVTWLITENAKWSAEAVPGGSRFVSAATSPDTVGEPNEWGGVSLNWLRIKAADHRLVTAVIDDLVNAACSGSVETKDSDEGQRSIRAEEWVGMTLDEDPNDTCSLVLFPKQRPTRSQIIKMRPLFKRDDVLKLSATTKMLMRAFKSDEALDRWMRDYCKNFLEENGRAPFRNKNVVEKAKAAGFSGVNRIYRAYARLPDSMRVPARKPRRNK
ncbi:MAG: hypothetical protein JW395_0428 [Nitrospira sp.]|nr:hypothetical protein [Nitrospira sp.]